MASLVSPELFYEQLQLRIESIPVPQESPQYQKYKQYYLRQYQQSLQEYNAHHAQWQKNRPLLNWQALWHRWRARIRAGKDPLSDSKKMESFLKEMGEEV